MTKEHEKELEELRKQQQKELERVQAAAKKEQELADRKTNLLHQKETNSLAKEYQTLVDKAQLQSLINQKQMEHRTAEMGVWDAGMTQAGKIASKQGVTHQSQKAKEAHDTALSQAKAEKALKLESSATTAKEKVEQAKQKAEKTVTERKQAMLKQEEADRQAAIKKAQSAANKQQSSSLKETDRFEQLQYESYVNAITDQWMARGISEEKMWDAIRNYETLFPYATEAQKKERQQYFKEAYLETITAWLRASTITKEEFFDRLDRLEDFLAEPTPAEKGEAKRGVPKPIIPNSDLLNLTTTYLN